MYIPFLHLTVGFTGVVDKSADVSHPVPVYECPTVQVEAVVVTFLGVILRHASSELLLTDHLS